MTMPMPISETLRAKINALITKLPETQRILAASLLARYGQAFFDITVEDAWQYLERLMAGDFNVLLELDFQLSSDEWIAKVKANTARWENVAQYNKIRDDLRKEILLRLATVFVGLLFGLVGL